MLLGEQIQTLVHLGNLRVRQGNHAGAAVNAVKSQMWRNGCTPGQFCGPVLNLAPGCVLLSWAWALVVCLENSWAEFLTVVIGTALAAVIG